MRLPKPVYLTLLLLILGGVVATIGCWWLPWRAHQRMVAGNNAAESTLRRLFQAEIEFRQKRGDSPSFWTGDVAGLYPQGEWLSRSLAEADARPLKPLVERPKPKSGYYFVAMDADGSTSPAEPYRQRSDGTGAKVLHPKKFAFCAYPAECPVRGYQVYIINQDATLWCRNTTEPKPTLTWPSDDDHTQHDWHWPGDH